MKNNHGERGAALPPPVHNAHKRRCRLCLAAKPPQRQSRRTLLRTDSLVQSQELRAIRCQLGGTNCRSEQAVLDVHDRIDDATQLIEAGLASSQLISIWHLNIYPMSQEAKQTKEL